MTPASLPPVSFFVVSAIFHYLGPSLAVLLVTLLALGGVLAGMNALFYLAVARLPLATVGAIEFLGTVVLAALGARTRRNAAALALCVGGVAVLTAIQAGASPLGLVFAFGNCAGFMLYVVLGHRIANTRVSDVFGGIDQLGAAMLIAAVAVTPAGLGAALPAFTHPAWLAWGIAVVLHQIPSVRELAGIALVIAGIAVHQADTTQPRTTRASPPATRPGRRGSETSPAPGGSQRRPRQRWRGQRPAPETARRRDRR